jgi:2,5-dioxopentanoate dehydrogenase
MALMEAASNRPQPIPVYAEMSSTNPVVFLPEALAQREEALAEEFFQSLTLGVGQFCTNPGLVFLPEGHGAKFLARLRSLVEGSVPGTMLNGTISEAFAKTQEAIARVAGVETVARSGTSPTPSQAAAVVFSVSMRRFLEDDFLQGEMFGPGTLVVRGSVEEIERCISSLEGQLTGTIHGTEEELVANAGLVEALQRKVGRLICNGFPTGLEVCPSTVHGGPFPSTSDGRSSSVGTMAILRFVRPVAWQNFPEAALPAELQDANPLRIARLVDGKREEPVRG